MNKRTLILSAAALLLAGTGIAVAAQPAGDRSPDANGDGVISLEEAKAKAAQRFARMDINNDGQLDKSDREAKRAARFEATDTNGDGELSQAEMTAAREARMAQQAERRAERQAARFARLDTDDSGGVSKAEMLAAHEARGERRGQRGEMRQGRGGDAKGMHRGMHRGMRMMRQADTNKDQVVTRAEFDAAIEARFAKVDTDNSGTITAEERKAARETMRALREERRGQRGNRSL